VKGERTDSTPLTPETRWSILVIDTRAGWPVADPVLVCQTIVPVFADAVLLPALASRRYAVLEALAGKRLESLKCVPATPTAAARTMNTASQLRNTTFRCLLHQVAKGFTRRLSKERNGRHPTYVLVPPASSYRHRQCRLLRTQ
jgi:hypothetical protein